MIQLREHRSPIADRAAPRLAILPDPPPLPDLELPDLPDLELRLHSPRAEVVVVRVSGAVDERGAGLLGERVGQQLARAAHVVVDLAGVPTLRHSGTRVLADLDREATRCGACLHISGVEDDGMRELLRSAHLDPQPCTDAVVALIPPHVPRRRRRR